MKERRGQQADALAKWADEVDADDLIEVGASAVGTSMVGRRDASSDTEVSCEH
jgi:hypothetical protein